MIDDDDIRGEASDAEVANENRAEPSADGEGEPADPVARLEAEKAELREQLLRTAAEIENLRKRTARELADARQYAIAGFARDMLTASDSVSRALSALPEKERQGAEGTLKALIEGIELTEREMQRLLEKHGISRIDPKGERFDPHVHQAMFEVTDTEADDGTVVEVVQAGYLIGERVLRPAMVGVARKTRPSDPAPTSGEEDSGTPGNGGVDKSV
jgi:molecular chaperone GrpE